MVIFILPQKTKAMLFLDFLLCFRHITLYHTLLHIVTHCTLFHGFFLFFFFANDSIIVYENPLLFLWILTHAWRILTIRFFLLCSNTCLPTMCRWWIVTFTRSRSLRSATCCSTRGPVAPTSPSSINRTIRQATRHCLTG